MTVKPSWHTVAVEVDDSDPFADDFSLPVRVNEVGTPIELTGETAKLSEALTVNVQHQSRLYHEGVDCDLRWNNSVTCLACPLYQGAQDTPHGHLCRLMREQETLTTLLVVRGRGGNGD
jgi:hypothetical protein